MSLFHYFWNFFLFYLHWPTVLMTEFFRKVDFMKRYRRVSDGDTDFPDTLAGATCVMTGGSRGIGADVARGLLKKGCHVITGSSAEKMEITRRQAEILNDLGDDNRGLLEIYPLDLSKLDSVRRFADIIRAKPLSINYLICCAGVMLTPKTVTDDDQEYQTTVNYLSHALLVWLLNPKMARIPNSGQSHRKSRIILVSSFQHRSAHGLRLDDFTHSDNYSPHQAYAQSKAEMVIFTIKYNEYIKQRKEDNYLTVNAVNPGLCMTDMIHSLNWMFYLGVLVFPVKRTHQEGADQILHAALSSDLEQVSGEYLDNCNKSEPSATTLDRVTQEKLWKITWDVLKKWTENTPLKEDYPLKEVITQKTMPTNRITPK